MKRNNRFLGFLRNNSVYIVLAVALLSVGVFGVGRILNSEKQDVTKEPQTDEMVEQTVTGEPDQRTTTTKKSQATTATTITTKEHEEEAPELFVFPLSNTVQKAFSSQAPLYSETLEHWALHLGTDFAGELDQKVKSLARGTVVKVARDALWGDVIVVDHGVGVESRYCGVKASVHEGDSVKAGDVIGTLTEIPCEGEQAPHLHLEMTIDGSSVDPVEAIALEVRYAETLEEEEE